MKPRVDVLVVEDERVVREAAARILRLDGFVVDLAEEASAAVARLRESPPRAVLTDLMLPGFSGFDLLDRLANDRPQLPVVLITGYATIENALHAFQHGAFDFLPKPFDVAELLGTMRRALRAAQRHLWNAAAPSRDLLAADAAARPERMRFLGQHSWAALDGREATFGVAESFPGLLEGVVGVSLPRPGDTLTQGLSFAEISTADQSVHRVWAPLSGTVLESNAEIARSPDLLNTRPFSSGWLTRVALLSLEQEQESLTIRNGTLARPGPLAPRNDGTKEKRWSS